jgi:hypothetical protein
MNKQTFLLNKNFTRQKNVINMRSTVYSASTANIINLKKTVLGELAELGLMHLT